MKGKLWKSLLIVLSVVLALTVLGGCGQQAQEGEGTQGEDKQQEGETRIIVDQRGVEVEVPKSIQRMVVLPMPLPSVIYSIVGSGESIAGMHPTSMVAVERSILAEMAPEMLKAETGFVTQGFEVNLEELVKLDPDVVVQWGHVPDVVEEMEEVGLPVIVIEVRKGCSQDNFEEWLRIVGELFGKEARTSELAKIQRDIIDEVKGRVAKIEQKDRPRVFFFFNEELRTAGGDTHHNFWLEGSGGINVARDLSGWKNVDMEQILEWNPEVIFVSNFTDIMPQDILEDKIEGQEWGQVDAVKNGRVYKIPEGVYRWEPPNAERALLFKWVAQKNFPEIFADYDMKKIVKDFYEDFYNRELTSEEVKTILHYDKN